MRPSPLLVVIGLTFSQGCVIEIPAFGDRWLPGSTVDLVVDGDEALLQATVRATEAWEAAGAPVRFHVVTGDVEHVAAYDGVPAVFYGERMEHQLGSTYEWSSEWEPALITEVDIVIDRDQSFFTDMPTNEDESYDLEALMLHEIGHGLGLDHLDEEDATMWPELEPVSTSKRSLERADVAALHDLYATR